MDIFLESLKKSIEHLQIIDSVFSEASYPESEIYKEIKENINRLDVARSQNKFSEELYVGGKKKNNAKNTGYSRQMILSDVIEYILNGRGYYYAIRDREAMKTYIRIILEIVNQLMIFDSLTVNTELRKVLLDKLKERFDNDLFKESDRKNEHEALSLHDSPIGFPLQESKVAHEVLVKLGLKPNAGDEEKALRRLNDYYDSLLPKTAGGLWGELLVYVYLLRQNAGYIFPLFLNQRILSGDEKAFLKPPDLLFLPYGKETFFGIEVGRGKDIQSGNFSIVTGIPTATKANADNPKRCCICGKWMLFCPIVIQNYSDMDKRIDKLKKPINCISECTIYKPEEIQKGKCFYAMHEGGHPKNYIMKMGSSKTYHFHLNCLKKDPGGAKEVAPNKIVMYYPYVEGLERFEKFNLDKEEIEKKINDLKIVLSELNRLEETESNGY